MKKDLLGKVAIVTGASKGIGAGIALYLANEGASVVVNYSSSQQEAEQLVQKIEKAGGKAVAIQANISKKADVKHLFKETKRIYQTVDILINNAGVYEFQPLEKITAEHYHKIFDLNVLGLLFASQEALKYFPKEGGNIINISSVASRSPSAETAVYSASKAAVDAITRALAKELGVRNIRVNAINPGLVKTEGVRDAGIDESDFEKEYIKKASLGRAGLPQDIAPLVTFLASADASWITGEIFYISGGFQ